MKTPDIENLCQFHKKTDKLLWSIYLHSASFFNVQATCTSWQVIV